MISESMNTLRARIDIIDAQISDLILKRIELSNSIIKAKAPGQIVDRKREEEIYNHYWKKLGPVSSARKTKRLVDALVATASLYPED